MTDQQQKIIARIKDLRAKTVEAGATEAEAIAAAAMAQRLMAQYRIEGGDIEAADYAAAAMALDFLRRHIDVIAIVTVGVEHVAGVRVLWSKSLDKVIIGDEVGRELALYLFDLASNVVEAAWKIERRRRVADVDKLWEKVERLYGRKMSAARAKLHKQDHARKAGISHDKVAAKSFRAGMAYRIDQRLQAMPPARAVPDAVVLNLMGPPAPSAPAPTTTRSDSKAPELDFSAFHAGSHAGDNAALGFGVGHERAARIGRDR